MYSFLMKVRFPLFLGAFILFGGASLFYSLNDTITIESEESKNEKMQSVFNQIRFLSEGKRDIWMMNQSHFGSSPKSHQWERLAIVIDKTKSPMTARYYQLSPGPLIWSDDLVKERVNFRASCFICHSNGPRAIRPQYASVFALLSLKDRLKIQILNLRIKTYGRINFDEKHRKEDVIQKPPFHFSQHKELETLKVKTCLKCHNESGFLSRGMLVRQQSGTIEHLVETGHMPPPGFSLSNEEKKQLRDFLRGF